MTWATRNRIAHSYPFVDREIIMATVENDLPHPEEVLSRLLMELT